MKALVIDIKKHYSIVLSKDGRFLRIPFHKSHLIGSETDFLEGVVLFNKSAFFSRIASIAATVFIILFLGAGTYAFASPYKSVSVDINPSIRLDANIFNVVIKTEALNSDARRLLEKHRIGFYSLEGAIGRIIELAHEQGYLDGKNDTDAILFTIPGKDIKRTPGLLKDVEKAADESLERLEIDVEVVVQETDDDAQKGIQEKAQEFGITSGKFNLIEKAVAANPSLKIENLKNLSVKEIMKEIKNAKDKSKVKAADKTGNNGKAGGEGVTAATGSDGKNDPGKNNTLDEDNENKGNSNKDNNNGKNSGKNSGKNNGKNSGKNSGSNGDSRKEKVNDGKGNNDKNDEDINSSKSGKNGKENGKENGRNSNKEKSNKQSSSNTEGKVKVTGMENIKDEGKKISKRNDG